MCAHVSASPVELRLVVCAFHSHGPSFLVLGSGAELGLAGGIRAVPTRDISSQPKLQLLREERKLR